MCILNHFIDYVINMVPCRNHILLNPAYNNFSLALLANIIFNIDSHMAISFYLFESGFSFASNAT